MIRYKTRMEIQVQKVIIPLKDNKLNIEMFFTITIEDMNVMKAKANDVMKLQMKIEEKKKEKFEK